MRFLFWMVFESAGHELVEADHAAAALGRLTESRRLRSG
jgi:hypothetical protein